MKEEIRWLCFNDEAFKKAKRESKLILLDLFASWCYWCSRMEHDTYSNEEIIKFVNWKFIPVKVDIDKRPDLKERYNLGGFPTTAFLNEKGELITGATYLPPDHFRILAEEAISNKNVRSATLFESKIESIKELSKKCNYKIDQDVVDEIFSSLIDNFDIDYGGFFIQPKFPVPFAIELIAKEYEKTKDKRYLTIINKTLTGMQEIFDKVEGGFFRYSVTRDWKEPHYEKMLDTNSFLIQDYLIGYQITKDDNYKDIAIASLNYIQENLFNKSFLGSQTADEDYYKLSKEERVKTNNPEIDETVYTDWSSMMISTFFTAFKELNNKNYKDIALNALDFLINNNYKNKNLNHYYDLSSRKINVSGIFSDYCFLIKSLIEAYQLTNNKKYLDLGIELTEITIKNFYDEKHFGFFDKLGIANENIEILNIKNKDVMENSIMASNLIKLFNITKNRDYMEIAKKTLGYFSCQYQIYSVHASIYALSIIELLNSKI